MAAINGGRNALTKGRNAVLWDALEMVNERVIVNAKDNEVEVYCLGMRQGCNQRVS